jgi:hypothetical protein
MSGKKLIFAFAIVWLLCVSALFGQTYPTGAILDPVLYERVPQKAVQLTRSYTSLPAAYSIKQYAPQPGDQSPYGTCTAWASTYAARTMAESIALNRRDRFLTTQNVFSPLFVYKSVHFYNYDNPDPLGDKGIAISYALEFLKKEGAIKRPRNELALRIQQFDISAYSRNKRYPIDGYARLYASYLQLTEDGDPIRTQMVKKSISEGRPVIIGIKCPSSFHGVGKNEVWYPTEDPASIDPFKNAHALCVVGYDDKKEGGAFEIQNSWGTDWGNGGYVWIPYTVFNSFAYEAYEMIENLALYTDGAEYEGSVEIQVRDSDKGMPVRFENGYYRTTDSYPSETRFRYYVGNKKPANVYAFAGDSSTTETTMIFPPPDDNISPLLDYSENTIALPGESWWIRLNQTSGTDYLVVLYSREELDIEAIRSRFSRARGTFPERAASAVGSNYMPASQASFAADKMQFSAKSGNRNAVLGLLLAIDHK